MKKITELMRQVEMLNDILKLLEGGIDLVLSAGGETFRGKRWQSTDNIAQRDEQINVPSALRITLQWDGLHAHDEYNLSS